MSTYQTRTTCRSCQGQLYSVFDLGPIVPSDFLLPTKPDGPALPLDLCLCESCYLVQLQHTVDPESLFRQYWYVSGTNEAMQAELASVVASVLPSVQRLDRVIDIGANDGTLLHCYPDHVHKIAFEPAHNLIDRCGQVADVTYNEFFPGYASSCLEDHSAQVITSIACFYDVDDPISFVAEIDRLLCFTGTWVVQMQDLAQMLQSRAFDNIVHEHLITYSLQSFMDLLVGFDLKVVHAERRAINGGSLRIVVQRRNQRVRPLVDVLLTKEEPYGQPDALERFAWQAGQVRTQLQEMIHAASAQGPIDLYAASTKSSTLLQYCGLDASLIRQAAERTPEKVGRVTSGTRIPVVSEEQWRKDPAPTSIIGAWQWAEGFIRREATYLAEGGRFLQPLPTVRLIGQAKEHTA